VNRRSERSLKLPSVELLNYSASGNNFIHVYVLLLAYVPIILNSVDFLQSCEGSLVVPTVPPGHVWSGDKV
jgi:hypothetical protein